MDDVVAPRPTKATTQAAGPYTMIRLPLSRANAMNQAGLIIGFSTDHRPAVYDNGAIHFLQIPGGYTQVWPTAISSNGIIAGYGTSHGSQYALVWSNYAASPRIVASKIALYPRGVNSSGTVVGYKGAVLKYRAFAWNAAWGLKDIHPAGWDTSAASYISDSGFVSGSASTSGSNYVQRWYPDLNYSVSVPGASVPGSAQGDVFEDGSILAQATTRTGSTLSAVWNLANSYTPVGPTTAPHQTHAISRSGRLVGTYYQSNTAYAWTVLQNSPVTYIQAPAGADFDPMAVSACGNILGDHRQSSGVHYWSLWVKSTCDQPQQVFSP